MKRSGIRRFVFGLAVASFAGAVSVAGVFLWAAVALGIGSVAAASLFATTLFLCCCGVVLYLLSQPARPINAD